MYGPSAPPIMEIAAAALSVEAKEDGKEVSNIDTKLCSCTHDKALRIGDQRTKIGHRTYTHENKGW